MKKLNLLVCHWILEALSADKIDFAVGGQAVIEGVMMRSPNSIAIAVRKLDGSIKVKEQKYRSLIQKHRWLNIPIIRGVINLFEMMIIGTHAINYSANESLEEPEQKQAPKTKWGRALETFLFILSFVFALALSIFLFKFIPLWLTTFIEGYSSAVENNFMIFNLIDGILKLSIFIAYVGILTLIPSFYRIFEYHGAEHKAIFAYERGVELTPPEAQKQTRFHPRCGTSFILIVFIISIIVYTFIPKQDAFINNLLIRVAALPLIAGISYEYLKTSAKYSDRPFAKALVAPGLWLQKLTTKEPKLDQLEVSIRSLEAALALESKATS